jgi:hypothetical protein
MNYGQYPFWLKNQRDHAEGDASFLKRENEELKKELEKCKKKVEKLERELKTLKEK